MEAADISRPTLLTQSIGHWIVHPILTLGAHAQEGYSTYFVCVFVCLCVCSKFAAFKSSLYDKMDLPAYFSPVFLDFQFIDLSKMP